MVVFTIINVNYFLVRLASTKKELAMGYLEQPNKLIGDVVFLLVFCPIKYDGFIYPRNPVETYQRLRRRRRLWYVSTTHQD